MKTAPTPLRANGLCNPFTNRKKWEITCGACFHTWVEKVPINLICSAICPNLNCRAQNVWSLSNWVAYYERELEADKRV